MSTAAACGYTGLTNLGDEITRWEISQLQDAIDATSMDSAGDREYIACLQSLEGTFDTQIPCGSVGSEVGVSFMNDLIGYSFDCYVTDVKNSVPVGDKVTFTYSFVSTGEVTVIIA